MSTKINTRFSERSKHQLTEKGTVFEHELSTLPDLASIMKLGNFQIPEYKSGNMVITKDSEQSFRKNVKGQQAWAKNESGDTWNGEILSQYPEDVNSSDQTFIYNYDYSKLENFVYYGSALEMLKASVSNIVSTFPGEIYTRTEIVDGVVSPVRKMYRDTNGQWQYAKVELCFMGAHLTFDTEVCNPFDINIYNDKVNTHAVDFNPIKNICQETVHNFEIVNQSGHHQIELYMKAYLEYNAISDCYEVVFDSTNKKCYNPGEPICIIILGNTDLITIEDMFMIAVIQGNNGELIYLTFSEAFANFHIRPKQEYLDRFYAGLEPFEHYLLNPYSRPKYNAQFVVRNIDGEREYKTIENYVFPTDDGGYNIAIEGPAFQYYVQRLTELAMMYDEYLTDNVWRSMVHESIKAFDWTVNPNDKEDYIEGAGKLQKILRLFAAFFDKIKLLIDNIERTDTITYSTKDNATDYNLSDLVDIKGIDPINVIPFEHKNITDGTELGEETNETICSNLVYDESGRTAEIQERYFSATNESVSPYDTDDTGYFEICCGVHVPAEPGEEIKSIDRYYVGYMGKKVYFDCDDNLKLINASGETEIYPRPLDDSIINLPFYVEGDETPHYQDFKILKETLVIGRINQFTSNAPMTTNEVNYEFLRRLRLNATSIIRRKGTIAGIEEILSLFGLKSQRFVDRYCGDKDFVADYKIEESTLYTIPITDNYDSRYRMPYFDYLNTTKSFTYNTDNFRAGVYDPYRGLPVRPVNFYLSEDGVTTTEQKYGENGNTRRLSHRVIYPYFDKNAPHDGNLYYQMYGGWLNKDLSFTKNGLTLCRSQYPKNFTETLNNVHSVACPDNLSQIPFNELYDDFYCEIEDSTKQYLNVNGQLYEIFHETISITNSSTLTSDYYDCAYIVITLGPNGGLVGDKNYDGMVYISDPCFSNFLKPVLTTSLTTNTKQKVYLYQIDTTNVPRPVGAQILSTAHQGDVKISLYNFVNGSVADAAIYELVTDHDEYSSYWKLDNKTKNLQYSFTSLYAPQYDGGWVRLKKDSQDVVYLETIITKKTGNNPHSAKVGYDNGLAYIDRFASLFMDAYPDNINETCLSFPKEDYGYEEFGFPNLYNDSGDTTVYIDDKAHAFCNRIDASGIVADYGATGNTLFDVIRNSSGDTYPSLGVDDSCTDRIINTKYVDITFYLTGNETIDRYKYYDSVIIGYLEQVLPSTIICNINYEIAETKCSIKVQPLPLNAGPTTGTGVYECGSEVTITAEDGEYYEFEKWSDGTTGNTRNVNADGNVTYFAKYHGKNMLLNVDSDNITMGVVNPYNPTGITAEYGSFVRIMALPKPNYRFDHWRVDGEDKPYYNTTMDVEIQKPVTTYTAVFRPSQDTFIIEGKSANAEWGEVYGSKNDAAYGEVVKLEAIPFDCCYSFDSWCDDPTITASTRYVTAVTDATYTAIFKANQYNLILEPMPADESFGTLIGSGTYDCGYIDIEAIPADGCYFVEWCDGNTNAQRQFYLNGDTQLCGKFAHYGELIIKNHPNSPSGCTFLVNGTPYWAPNVYDNVLVKTYDHFVIQPQPNMNYIANKWTYSFQDINPGSTVEYSQILNNDQNGDLIFTGATTLVNAAVLTIECYGCNQDIVLMYDDYATYKCDTKKLIETTDPYSYQNLSVTTQIKGTDVSGLTTASFGTEITLEPVTVDPMYDIVGWEVKTDRGVYLTVDPTTNTFRNTAGACNDKIIVTPILKNKGYLVTIEKLDFGQCGLIGFEKPGETMEDIDIKSIAIQECDSVTLKAQPCSGCTFDGWYDMHGKLVSMSETFTITPTSDVTYRPKFTCQTIEYNVNLSSYFYDPSCALVSANTMQQPTTATTITVESGTDLTIEAIIGDDCPCTEFDYWSGITDGQQVHDNPYTLTNINKNMDIVARFKEKDRQTITAISNNASLGLVVVNTHTGPQYSGQTTVSCNKSVTLTAVTIGNCGVFDHWENVNNPTETYPDEIVTITNVTNSQTYRAVFTAIQYTVNFNYDNEDVTIIYNINDSGETMLPHTQQSITVKCGDNLKVRSKHGCCSRPVDWQYQIEDEPPVTVTDNILELIINNNTDIYRNSNLEFEINAQAVGTDLKPLEAYDCAKYSENIYWKNDTDADYHRFPTTYDCNNPKINSFQAVKPESDCCMVFDHWEIPIQNDDSIIIYDNPAQLTDKEKSSLNFCNNTILAVYRYPQYELDFSLLPDKPDVFFDLRRTDGIISMESCKTLEEYLLPAYISIRNPKKCFKIQMIDKATGQPIMLPNITICGQDECYLLPYLAKDIILKIKLADTCPDDCNQEPTRHACKRRNQLTATTAEDPVQSETNETTEETTQETE